MADHRQYDLVPLQRLLKVLDDETRLELAYAPRFIHWFDHEPLSAFSGLTARQLVERGCENDVARYLSSLLDGFLG